MSATELGQAIALTQTESRARAIAELDPAKRVAFVAIPNDPLGRYVQVQTGATGEATISDPIVPEIESLGVDVMSLTDFAEVGAVWGVKTVLVSDDRVVGLVDPLDRRDRIRLDLPFTAAFELLRRFATRTPITQAELVRMLRLELADSIVDESAKQLLKFAEAFEVNTGATQAMTVKRDRESLGRSIEASVKADAGDLPQVVLFSVRVHLDASLSVARQLHVQIDFSPSSSTFFLLTREADIRAALEAEKAQTINLLVQAHATADQPPAIVGACL